MRVWPASRSKWIEAMAGGGRAWIILWLGEQGKKRAPCRMDDALDAGRARTRVEAGLDVAQAGRGDAFEEVGGTPRLGQAGDRGRRFDHGERGNGVARQPGARSSCRRVDGADDVIDRERRAGGVERLGAPAHEEVEVVRRRAAGLGHEVDLAARAIAGEADVDEAVEARMGAGGAAKVDCAFAKRDDRQVGGDQAAPGLG